MTTARPPRTAGNLKTGCGRDLALTISYRRIADGAEEMTGHRRYEKRDPAGQGSGNSRNGTTPKTVLTDLGAVYLGP